MSSRSLLLSVLAVTATLVACGGADHAPEPKTPTSTTREPTTIEEAQAEIARAKAELGPRPDAASRFAEPPPKAPAPPPPPPPQAEPARPSDSKAESTTNTDSCQSPCRAIASMRRAVGALCRLTGDEDARCSDAKKTLADSEARIVACSC